MIYQLNIADFQLTKRGGASLCQDWQPNLCWWRISSKLRKLQGIADFENELKTYQGGLKKEAYYFYKRHLDKKNIADLFKATERLMVENGCKFMSMWLWINTYRYIFSGLFTSINPSYDLGFTRYQGFDPSPCYFPIIFFGVFVQLPPWFFQTAKRS